MNQIMNHHPLTISGDGEQIRTFTYIDDVAPIIARSVQNKSAYRETFNIGGDQPYTVNQLVQAVYEVLGKSPSITYRQTRNEIIHAYASHNKLLQFFNPLHPLNLKRVLQKRHNGPNKWEEIKQNHLQQ